VIAGVVLAAGRGERFGSDKLVRELGGRPLILHTLANCTASSLDAVLVVVGEAGGGVDATVRAAFAREPRVSVVYNPDAMRGHITSLKAGLRSLPHSARAAAVFLADMPFVDARITDRLIDEYRRTGGFVLPLCEQTWRHPRLIPAAHFGDFLALDDASGGGVIFERFRDSVRAVAVGESWNFSDVDTAEDLARAQRLVRP